MFYMYQHDFSVSSLNIIGDRDTDNEAEVYCRYSYTYEHKLATIDIVITT